MATKLEELKKQEQKIIKQMNSIREVSRRRPIDKTEFNELVDEVDFPPYWLTMAAWWKFGGEIYEDITEEPANGRVRGKVETALNKTFAVLISGTLTLCTVPFVFIVETPMALPALGVLGAQSAIFKKYNKNIKKAKQKMKDLELKLDETLKQIKQEQANQTEIQL